MDDVGDLRAAAWCGRVKTAYPHAISLWPCANGGPPGCCICAGRPRARARSRTSPPPARTVRKAGAAANSYRAGTDRGAASGAGDMGVPPYRTLMLNPNRALYAI